MIRHKSTDYPNSRPPADGQDWKPVEDFRAEPGSKLRCLAYNPVLEQVYKRNCYIGPDGAIEDRHEGRAGVYTFVAVLHVVEAGASPRPVG